VRGIAAVALALALLGARGVRAELIEVLQPASGMECPECSRSLRLALRELDGADALATSWNRRLVTATFRADSRATLRQLRGIVRAQHFLPREAEVTLAGTLAWRQGELVVDVSGSGESFVIQDGVRPIRAVQPLPLGQPVVVKGRVPAAGRGEAERQPLLLLLQELRIRPSAHR
jgi:hypothetical protein